MTRETFRQVEIDRCPECSGIYLDKDELEQIVSQKIEKVEECGPLKKSGASATAICPKCEKEMFELTGAADVRFDWCMDCEGMFFDQGELSVLQFFEAE
jgi:Zn-finger nucleic acid-binding protein